MTGNIDEVIAKHVVGSCSYTRGPGRVVVCFVQGSLIMVWLLPGLDIKFLVYITTDCFISHATVAVRLEKWQISCMVHHFGSL